MYKIVVSYTAEKQLQNLSSVYYKRVINKLQQLQINPFDVSGYKEITRHFIAIQDKGWRYQNYLRY